MTAVTITERKKSILAQFRKGSVIVPEGSPGEAKAKREKRTYIAYVPLDGVRYNIYSPKRKARKKNASKG